MRPGRADEAGRVEGRVAGFGRVGEGSWGVLRARGVGLLAREGMGRSGVRGEPLGERGRCGEERQLLQLSPPPATVTAPRGFCTENKACLKYILISQTCGVRFSLGAALSASDLDPWG